MNDLKQRIVAAIPIESYIGRFVKLKKTGKNYSGLCPFHQEKSPSFSVRPETGRYHCFGCGKDGDLFSFIMEREGITFSEALDELCRYAGIERSEFNKPDPNRKYYEVSEQILTLYKNHLKTDAQMMEYLTSRKVTTQAITDFELGSSPDSWNWLEEQLRGSSPALLKELGFIRSKEGEERTYDFFRRRLMFPIRDETGKLCGFGGRAMPGADDRAKYINSPDSRVFHKNSLLYGLYPGIREIRSQRQVILVEGYLDVIGLHAAGIQRAVAPLGTAFTENQLKLVERYADTIYCMLDGDKAGRAAALKAARLILEKSSLQLRVVILPEGLDAFDLSVNHDPASILTLLGLSVSGERYLLIESMFPATNLPVAGGAGTLTTEHLLQYAEEVRKFYERKRTDATAEQKRVALDLLKDLTRSLPVTIGQILAQEGAQTIGLDARALSKPTQQDTRPKAVAQSRPDAITQVERAIVCLLILHPGLLLARHEDTSSIQFKDDASEIMFRYLEARALSGSLWSLDTVFSDQVPDQVAGIFNGLISDETDPNADDVLSDLILAHKIRIKEKELHQIDSELVKADPVTESELRLRKQAIILELQPLVSKKNRSSEPGVSVQSSVSQEKSQEA